MVKILPDIEVSSDFDFSYYASGWVAKPNIGLTKETYFSNINITKIKASEAAKIRFYQYNGFKYAPCSIVLNNGKDQDSYSYFNNKTHWAGASGLTSSTGTCTGENPGDLSAPFTLSYDGHINHKVKFTVGDLSIEIEAAEYEAGNSTKVGPQYNFFKWDSKTGIVSAVVNNDSTPVVISCSGEPCGALPVGNSAVTVQKWQDE